MLSTVAPIGREAVFMSQEIKQEGGKGFIKFILLRSRRQELQKIAMMSLVFVLLVSAFCGSAYADCIPAEEGQTTNITCAVDKTSCPELINQSFQWFSNLSIVATYGPDVSSNSSQDGISVTNDNSISTLTIGNVSRSAPMNMETKWKCVGVCFDSSVACAKLQIYAKPKDPVCTINQIEKMGENLTFTVTCLTRKVYPEAKCKFAWQKSDGTGEPKLQDSVITYKHTTTGESPVYYTSECTLSVQSVRVPGEGTHSLLGYIYPGVDGGEKLLDPVYIPVNVSGSGGELKTQGTHDENSTNNNKSKDRVLTFIDNTTLIVAAAAIFIVLVLIIAIALLARQNKFMKLRMMLQSETATSMREFYNSEPTSGGVTIQNEEVSGVSDRSASCDVDGSPTPSNRDRKGVYPKSTYTEQSPLPPSSSSSNVAAAPRSAGSRPRVPTLPPPETPTPKRPPSEMYVTPSSVHVDDKEEAAISHVNRNRNFSGQSNWAFVHEASADSGIYEMREGSSELDTGNSDTNLRSLQDKVQPRPHTKWRSQVPPVPAN